MRTRVVHVDDQVEGAVYIGRASPRKRLSRSEWRNPFTIGKHGTREEVIAKYEHMMRTFVFDTSTPNVNRIWRNGLAEIAGKPLACHCRHDGEERTPDNACHGDILVQLIEELGFEPEEE